MEIPKMRAIALGIALTTGVGLSGCIDSNSGELKESERQELAAALNKIKCPEGKKPVLHELYATRPLSKSEVIHEVETPKLPKKLAGLIVNCEPGSNVSAK
jgi:hypothetical protein